MKKEGLKKGDVALLMEYAHGREDPELFLLRTGVSERNWEIFIRRMRFFDGDEWSYGDLADNYGISRPRVVQIVQRTLERIQNYFQVRR